MTTNRDRFIDSYARRMCTHSACNPGLYEIPESFTELAKENVEKILSGEMSPGVCFIATLKARGAEPTYVGATDYLENALLKIDAEWGLN